MHDGRRTISPRTAQVRLHLFKLTLKGNQRTLCSVRPSAMDSRVKDASHCVACVDEARPLNEFQRVHTIWFHDAHTLEHAAEIAKSHVFHSTEISADTRQHRTQIWSLRLKDES